MDRLQPQPLAVLLGQSQKQSDCAAGWSVSWPQYPVQKCSQGYGWAREMGGFCRKVLALPVCLRKLRESVHKPVSKMVYQSWLQIQRRKGSGHLCPRRLTGGYASNDRRNPVPYYPCGSSAQHDHRNNFCNPT